jgi:peroxiredoxin Q/BCP
LGEATFLPTLRLNPIAHLPLALVRKRCERSLRRKEGKMAVALRPGDGAPDFELPGDGGAPTSLKGLVGRKIVLYFYPKDDTSGCTKEAIDFNGLRQAFSKANAEIIGISADSPASHAKFKKKHNLQLTLLADERKAVLEAYGVWTQKSMYGRKYMGVERTTFLIDARGKIAQIWEKVKVPGHAAEVLQAVENL